MTPNPAAAPGAAAARRPARVLIIGGGYIGLYSAITLERHLSAEEAEVTLVAPSPHMTYQPFLPEAAGGNIEPRHTVVPIRPTLDRTHIVSGRVVDLDHDARRATIAPPEGPEYAVEYDHVIIGAGAVSRVLPVPGLAENGVGFKSVGEAIYLRNHVISCLDKAESTTDPKVRRRALTFVFVGGGYAGVEALAELEDLACYACRDYDTVSPQDMRWVLVEAMPRILPEVPAALSEHALSVLVRRGIDVYLETRLDSAEQGHIVVSNGERFEAETLVWTTGVRAQPVLEQFGFETDERGRVLTDEYLRVRGRDGAWAAGDAAAVPDLVRGGVSPPTAQYALRQARRLGKNLAATIKGREMQPFRYKNKGLLVSLGRYQGVAEVMGWDLKGLPAWFLHRTYHLAMIPTLSRKSRVLVDWTVALLFRRDIVQLQEISTPRRAFLEAVPRAEAGKSAS
ncbi:MAG TPA: NAD(P)/FAD-dependent oxidoreductase [Actinomycetota bacterium]|jgi:NADH dehydrogenase|nr:NAD(P)/FAD-dependent oxidoreductase [Actinomycetota bacterium]